ncbi:hypothetical protein BH708_08760 [Brachybacterium sp. P6-10-X1]|uniref:DUF2252 domain-containing protein n=1 Tax=Brachybacterium sp. P6-10-X1 TaxID=1903186 RepID=UPI000971B7B7|nr:DUF2252 domain-containing protein [Brachybacterium sp. P6-10-X1]APX32797.1 hypothetical protein BH708_08760 [Brachybacterium sp. P6-10-X1]
MSEERADRIVHLLERDFSDLMSRNPLAFRRRFRKMAVDPFAFYRGSAGLFYDDVAELEDPWVDDVTSRAWIHGDLHAENFGTYMDDRGVLVFDVNDFDEAYLGHFTWDLLRCATSLALLGWRRAFPDDVIRTIVERYVRAYLDQVRHYVEADDDLAWSLNIDNAEGTVLATLRAAQASTRIGLLDRETADVDHSRSFRRDADSRPLEAAERERLAEAYDRYLSTIPEDKRLDRDVAYTVKDVVARSGLGIGSAGLTTYSLLIEGHSQALENDVLLSMKEGNVPAPSAVVRDPRLAEAFEHQGHRAAMSQRALQAHADPFLGWTELDGTGFVVREVSPYELELPWKDLVEPEDIGPLVADLGRATAKVHCVADADAEDSVVDVQVEDHVAAAVQGSEDDFVEWVQDFAMTYAVTTRADHRRFVNAFRAGAFGAVTAI